MWPSGPPPTPRSPSSPRVATAATARARTWVRPTEARLDPRSPMPTSWSAPARSRPWWPWANPTRRIGAVGPRVCEIDGTTYPSARPLPTLVLGAGHAIFGKVWPRQPVEQAVPDRPAPAGRRGGGRVAVGLVPLGASRGMGGRGRIRRGLLHVLRGRRAWTQPRRGGLQQRVDAEGHGDPPWRAQLPLGPGADA